MEEDEEQVNASGYISDEEDSRDKSADTTVRSDEDIDASNDLEETNPDKNDRDVTNEEQHVHVEHNLQELRDESLPKSGDLIGWNEEMRSFYNDSWNGENFSVHKVQRMMTGDVTFSNE